MPIGSSREPKSGPASPSAASRMKRLLSAMPSSMCCPRGDIAQFCGRRNPLVLERIGAIGRLENAPPVHPAAKIGRDRDVRRRRDDVVGERPDVSRRCRPAGDRTPAASTASRRRALRRPSGTATRRRDAAVAAGCAIGARRGTPADRRQARRARQTRSHSSPSLIPSDALKLIHLLGRHHAGVVVLVAGKRQTVSLDRVSDETGRPIVRDGVRKHRESTSGRGRPRFVISRCRATSSCSSSSSRMPDVSPRSCSSCVAPGGAALVGERRIPRVRTLVDPVAQRIAAAIGTNADSSSVAVLQRDHVPVHALEHRVHAMEDPVADHRVEALAVVVDDPPQIADIVLPRLRASPRRCCLRRIRRRRQAQSSGPTRSARSMRPLLAR